MHGVLEQVGLILARYLEGKGRSWESRHRAQADPAHGGNRLGGRPGRGRRGHGVNEEVLDMDVIERGQHSLSLGWRPLRGAAQTGA